MKVRLAHQKAVILLMTAEQGDATPAAMIKLRTVLMWHVSHLSDKNLRDLATMFPPAQWKMVVEAVSSDPDTRRVFDRVFAAAAPAAGSGTGVSVKRRAAADLHAARPQQGAAA